VHNLHIGRWSPEMIRVCARYAPVVCKLCDTWTFTGRCYNPGPCDRYLTRCDESCPTASEYPSLPPGRIGAAFELRREILDGSPNVVAVAPSEWIARMAAAGLWKSRAVFRIRNGIPLERYRPLDRESQRKSFGIPADAIVLLCCAGLLTERKKGLPLLLDALKLGLTRPVHLLLMGTPAPVPLIPNVEVHQLGYVTNDDEKAAVYGAADIYVHPSLADNSPNTIIESLACGTPSVAFPIDGVPEMVVPRETGWLANHVSAESLQAVLSEAIEAIGSGDTLRDSSRRFAETHYEMMTVVRQYERLFGQLTSGTTVAPGLRTTA
jgi:glycosyltransferase involved in cell wall biosynthesis